MTGGIIIAFIVLLLTALSVRARVHQRLYRDKEWSVIGEPMPSQISQALSNLVGVAGGIYLSLVVAFTFIDLKLPERVQLYGISMEPLAALSILIALAQPYFQRIINAWRRI